MKYLLVLLLLAGCSSETRAYTCAVTQNGGFSVDSTQTVVLNATSERHADNQARAFFPGANNVECEEW